MDDTEEDYVAEDTGEFILDEVQGAYLDTLPLNKKGAEEKRRLYSLFWSAGLTTSGTQALELAAQVEEYLKNGKSRSSATLTAIQGGKPDVVNRR